MPEQDVILFSGYAQLPSGTVSYEVYKMMGLIVLIDVRTGKILEADCTLSTRLSERFVSRLLIGRSIENELDAMIDDLKAYYQGNAQKAIITALHAVYDKYRAFMERRLKAGPLC